MSRNIPIITGEVKYDEKTAFTMGGFKFHPPKQYDHIWVMLFAVIAGGIPDSILVLHEAGTELAAFLSEDAPQLGKVGTKVRIIPTEKGTVDLVPAEQPQMDA